jgi:hypothetical protein
MHRARAGWLVASVLLVGVVLLPGCGKDDDSSTNADRTSTTGSSSTTAAPSTTASTTTTTAKPKVAAEYTLSYTGYGPFQLGMAFDAAQATGLLQAPGLGCELSGDETERSAQLVAPLDGAVVSAQGKLTVAWARSRFVTSPGALRDGDALAKAQAVDWGAGYTATLDKGGEASFGTWSVIVKHGEDLVLELLIDPATQKVTAAAAPYVPVCD